MTKEELKHSIAGLLPGAGFDDTGEWLQVMIDAPQWKQFAQSIKTGSGLDFDFLFCVTGVDWKTHLTMVYHLTSTVWRHNMVVKIRLDRQQPELDSVADVWRTADFNEREAYEMFGVHFHGHPDLRLLILPDGWEGRNPMRKDFEDPINMIKL